MDATMMDKVCLRVKDVVADEAARVLAKNKVGRLLIQIVLLQILERIAAG